MMWYNRGMNVLRRLAVFLMAVIVSFVVPASTYALTEAQMDFYAQNNILFYDPDGNGGNTCYGTLMGSTIFEKMLSALLGMGLNEVAAAGVYSNMMAEGFGDGQLIVHEYGVDSRADIGTYYSAATAYGHDGLYVTEADVRDLYDVDIMHGMGPNGWSYGLRVLFLEVLKEHGVEKYATEWDDVRGVYVYQGSKYNYDGLVKNLGEKEADRILAAVLDYFDRLYLKNEFHDRAFNSNGQLGYFVVGQNDIDAQGLAKYGITKGMTIPEALNLVATPYEAAELFFTTAEMPGWSTFNGHENHGANADAGLELIHSAGLTASGAINCGNNGDIVNTALALAWNRETEGQHAKDDPKPEYERAMHSVGTWYPGGPCGSSGTCAPNGASCDIFVSTVMKYSGVDVDFPNYGPTRQGNHMLEHPDEYEEIPNLGDASNLQPGDIFVAFDEHILIYMGIEDGKWMQASASFNGRTGEYFSYEEYVHGSGVPYRIFRRIK